MRHAHIIHVLTDTHHTHHTHHTPIKHTYTYLINKHYGTIISFAKLILRIHQQQSTFSCYLLSIIKQRQCSSTCLCVCVVIVWMCVLVIVIVCVITPAPPVSYPPPTSQSSSPPPPKPPSYRLPVILTHQPLPHNLLPTYGYIMIHSLCGGGDHICRQSLIFLHAIRKCVSTVLTSPVVVVRP